MTAVGRTTRTRQLQSRTRGQRNGRRRQNDRRQQQTSGTSVDQVEVTINTSGGGTNNGGPIRNTARDQGQQIGPMFDFVAVYALCLKICFYLNLFEEN
jgi:hypothetical protein